MASKGQHGSEEQKGKGPKSKEPRLGGGEVFCGVCDVHPVVGDANICTQCTADIEDTKFTQEQLEPSAVGRADFWAPAAGKGPVLPPALAASSASGAAAPATRPQQRQHTFEGNADEQVTRG